MLLRPLFLFIFPREHACRSRSFLSLTGRTARWNPLLQLPETRHHELHDSNSRFISSLMPRERRVRFAWWNARSYYRDCYDCRRGIMELLRDFQRRNACRGLIREGEQHTASFRTLDPRRALEIFRLPVGDPARRIITFSMRSSRFIWKVPNSPPRSSQTKYCLAQRFRVD